MRKTIALLLALAFLTIARHCAAQTPSCAELMQQGDDAFNAQKYSVAVQKFGNAYTCYLKENNSAENNMTAANMNRMGQAYSSLGDWGRAVACYSNAADTHLRIGGADDPGLPTIYNNIAYVHLSRGDYSSALDYYQRALTILTKIAGSEDTESVATCYNNAAAVYSVQQDYENAMSYYLKGLAIRTKILPPGDPAIATSLNNIGTIYAAQRKNTEALAEFSKALEIDAAAYGENHDITATDYNNIGAALQGLDRNDEAFASYNKSIEIKTKIYGEVHPIVAVGYNNMGALYAAANNRPAAIQFFRKALAAMCGGNPDALPAACRPEDTTIDAFRTLARAYHSMGEFATSTRYFSYSADALDMLRGAIDSEAAKKYHSGYYFEMFPEGIAAWSGLAQQTGDDSAIENAFEFAEKGIGRVFMEMIGRSRAAVDGNLPSDVITEGKEIRTRWQAAYDAVQLEENKTPDKKDQTLRNTVYTALQNAQTELEAYENRLLENYPDYAELMRPRTHPASEIKSILAPGETALEYIVGANHTWLFIINANSIKLRQLAPGGEIENLVMLYRTKMNSPSTARDTIDKTSAKLYDLLIRPVESEIISSERLLIVPTGRLYFLPFEALLRQDAAGSQYLVEKHIIRYAPSLNVLNLVESRKKTATSTQFAREWLGFGDPVYEREDARSSQRPFSKKTATEVANYTRDLGDSAAWFRLPATGEEDAAIAQLFGIPDNNDSLNLGANATEKRFKTLAPQGCRYIHIASHGTLGEGGASQPALVLSLIGNDEDDEDGFLKMTDVYNMKIPADMVVLSACKTGQGRMERGEGVAGLARAFFYSGANSLVVSLWSVADKETKDLMIDFYSRLRTGASRPAALREAKLSMISKSLSPFFWAPFIYIGTE